MAEQTPIPTFWFHVVEVIIACVILGAITFQIVKPTTNQKTIVQAGGTKIDYLQGATIKPGFGGCATIDLPKRNIVMLNDNVQSRIRI